VDILTKELRPEAASAYEPAPTVDQPRGVRGSPRIARAVNKVFDLHLLELAAPEYEVTGRDLVSKRLSDLSDAVREAKAALRRSDVLEVDENALRSLGSEIRCRGVVSRCTNACLKHEVERSRTRQRARSARVACAAGQVLVNTHRARSERLTSAPHVAGRRHGVGGVRRRGRNARKCEGPAHCA